MGRIKSWKLPVNPACCPLLIGCLMPVILTPVSIFRAGIVNGVAPPHRGRFDLSDIGKVDALSYGTDLNHVIRIGAVSA